MKIDVWNRLFSDNLGIYFLRWFYLQRHLKITSHNFFNFQFDINKFFFPLIILTITTCFIINSQIMNFVHHHKDIWLSTILFFEKYLNILLIILILPPIFKIDFSFKNLISIFNHLIWHIVVISDFFFVIEIQIPIFNQLLVEILMHRKDFSEFLVSFSFILVNMIRNHATN